MTPSQKVTYFPLYVIIVWKLMKPKAPYSLKHFWFHLSCFWELPPRAEPASAPPLPPSKPVPLFLPHCCVVSGLQSYTFRLVLHAAAKHLGRLKKSLVFPKKPHGKTFTWLGEFVLNPCLTFSFEDSGSWTHQSCRLGIRSECNSEKCSYRLD